MTVGSTKHVGTSIYSDFECRGERRNCKARLMGWPAPSSRPTLGRCQQEELR
jgi:hypothetical protein